MNVGLACASSSNTTLKEPDTSLYQPALESLRTLIRTSTASLTSVPKPLKFLRPHYPELQELYEKWPTTEQGAGKKLFADILSVLAMTYSDQGKRETLMYRLKGGGSEEPGTWGHEYVRHLAAEIEEEYAVRNEEVSEGEASKKGRYTGEELHELALRLVPFLLSHNGEADAVDLLLELEGINSIIPFVDENTYTRVCLYMTSCVNLLVPPDDREFLRCARTIYRKFEKYSQAIVCSLRLGDTELIKEDLNTPKNASMKRQLAFILARQQFHGADEGLDDEGLMEILNNTKLGEYFELFGKELNLVEPRSLEDIYKSHLENTRPGAATANVDSARQNLAGTFVNGYVNAGFGNDTLMAKAEVGQSWIYKNKDHGQCHVPKVADIMLIKLGCRYAISGSFSRLVVPVEARTGSRRYRHTRLLARRQCESWSCISYRYCPFGSADRSRRSFRPARGTGRYCICAEQDLCYYRVC